MKISPLHQKNPPAASDSPLPSLARRNIAQREIWLIICERFTHVVEGWTVQKNLKKPANQPFYLQEKTHQGIVIPFGIKLGTEVRNKKESVADSTEGENGECSPSISPSIASPIYGLGAQGEAGAEKEKNSKREREK